MSADATRATVGISGGRREKPQGFTRLASRYRPFVGGCDEGRQGRPPHRRREALDGVTRLATRGEGEGNVGRLRLGGRGLPPLKWDPCVAPSAWRTAARTPSSGSWSPWPGSSGWASSPLWRPQRRWGQFIHPGATPPSKDASGGGNRWHMSAEDKTRATVGISGGRRENSQGFTRLASRDHPFVGGRDEGSQRQINSDKSSTPSTPATGRGGMPSGSAPGLERQGRPPHRRREALDGVTRLATRGEGEGNVGWLRLWGRGLPPLKWDPRVASRVEDGCDDTAVRIAVSLAGAIRLGFFSSLTAAAAGTIMPQGGLVAGDATRATGGSSSKNRQSARTRRARPVIAALKQESGSAQWSWVYFYCYLARQGRGPSCLFQGRTPASTS